MGVQSGWSLSGTSGFDALWNVAAASAPFWLLLGGFIGLLLPRPKWLEASGRSGALLYVTPPGLFFRRAALFFHGAYLVRDIWNYFTLPGAAQGFLPALWNLLCGRGFTAPPQQHTSSAVVGKFRGHRRHSHAHHPEQLEWYVDANDLQFFKDRIEKPEPPADAGEWEAMMDKDFGNFTYTAWRRPLTVSDAALLARLNKSIKKNGKTEYKSVTVASNSTAEEFMDFYLDDRKRPNWDSMISETEVLENGPGNERCQVVRWVRSFPFSFISKREYVIARRMFTESGCLYGISKVVEHPRAVDNPDIVRMDNFYSMWRSRTIPDPRGGPQPACETVLLHHEQFKIPENLSRFAVRHGMAGFVKKMGPEIKSFVEERRQRCPAFEHDSDAFGVKALPNPPLRTERSSVSSSSCSEIDDTASEASKGFAMRRRASRRTKSVRRAARSQEGPLQKLVTLAAVGVFAVLMTRDRRK